MRFRVWKVPVKSDIAKMQKLGFEFCGQALNEDVPEILDKAAANRRALLQRALHATGE